MEPAQAAATIAVIPGTSSCPTAHGAQNIPADQRVADDLACDLMNCSPNTHVAVDGDTDTSVICSVKPEGGGFAVNASLSYVGNTVSVSGNVSSTGGEVTVSHYAAALQARYTGQCTLTIAPNRGLVKAGAIWASFQCPQFSDPSSASGGGCIGSGAFLFEKCDGAQ